MAEGGNGDGASGRKDSGLFVLFQRRFIHRFLLIRESQPQMGQKEIRIHLEHFFKLLYCKVILARIIMQPPDGAVDDKGKRVQFLGFPHPGKPFLGSPRTQKESAIKLMGGGVVRV